MATMRTLRRRLRELLPGPKRFTDLRACLPHVNSNVLAQRLRELEAEEGSYGDVGFLRRGVAPLHRRRATACALSPNFGVPTSSEGG
jgi:hypothetical protein